MKDAHAASGMSALHLFFFSHLDEFSDNFA
jgi:hypothetical protein